MATIANRIPGETAEYRDARDRLLEAEIALRRHVEEVAALRRALPLGAPLKEDYVFEELAADGSVREVKLSELFAPGKDTLVIYNFMYGPNMGVPCPMCSSMLDGLNGNAVAAGQRINLAVVAKSPLPRILEFTRQRGWNNLRILSSAENTYNFDYHGENPKNGDQWPMLNVFVRRSDGIHHFYATELFFAPKDPGMDARHIDIMWPLWNLLDFTPEGRGDKWYPKLSYT
jgi:predicted dithiol-disulfide oxidoreductase (DUF899 family)